MMFMLSHDEDVHPSYDIAVWLNTKFFASALSQLFNQNWATVKVKN
jgi:hypothetical protein